MRTERTQVAIVGAGPAGLLLSHLLHRRGITSVVLEIRSRDYVEKRVRAGVLEQGTVDTLIEAGVGERLQREGMPHHGIELRYGGQGHRIAFEKLVPGRCITVYGQQEVVKDLIAARLADAGRIEFEVSDVAVHDVDSPAPSVTYTDSHGRDVRLECDVIAGCDGFHGVTRRSIPEGVLTVYERDYPFAWLGVLARVAPSSQELIYSRTERGFALHSMRTPQISRFYLQVAPDETLEAWPDERIWAELKARLETVEGFTLQTGPILEKGITPMRSFVVEPMQYGRLYLAGDAAHIVPPTGAKGLNLAVADVRVLTNALVSWYRTGSTELLERYSADCLKRVWRAQHFSWWMTTLLHTFDSDDAFGRRLQLSHLDYVTGSEAAATTLAENYVGLPFESALYD
ncbi:MULTISPECIES: 4-hydroxybenzoate 3-monooxygenase [Thermomonospora]|uniref:4-hydroxybenzoate 3-monooxygenase n=1 Tax=Thermomonospora curvata (strain ATCC 19995 / DSM 43183 / JCM 3096 / KCTC 9072 / NBRC 15933 / NCIMB 10081 / Henssen B9) TaxID=471852 RepID=D1A3W7_THECD|nr:MULTISPECIES: 4-hydroxybenzoate 3-monooxygenase [Thermomonospora]ACY98020.1 4-hydroxybenzoate 3-monooxygenase [Thermomonospora curvata DSM 43183]PKK14297.1 MAG: 4-hydroxybenzoate 3-monooxygenase [Thermomonospora sp. CIF 1]